MRPTARLLALLILLLALPLTAANAGWSYRFSTTTEGQYAKHRSGRVIGDAGHWRIEFDREPGAVLAETAIIGGDGQSIALNDQNQTWYRPPSAWSTAISPWLFTYGKEAQVSKVKVTRTDGNPIRIAFSYRMLFHLGLEAVRGDVWGEIRMSPAQQPPPLPWNPLELLTGLGEVDTALSKAITAANAYPVELELEVSRRLERGAVLKQLVKRTTEPKVPATADPSLFRVPPGYRYQEPVIGTPGR